MSKQKTLDLTVLVAAVLGSLIMLNIISVSFFNRLDLTEGKEFTLSQATVDMLKGLKDPVTVTAYFSKDMPPPFSTNARYVKDLLEEYYSYAGSNLRYQFIDPLSEETAEDKEKKKEMKRDIFGNQMREETGVEKELRLVGIPPVQVRVNEDDKIEVKRAYMGIAISFGDKKEAIPVVQNTGGLEYDLTTMIRKVTRDKAPKIGIVVGHESPDLSREMGSMYGLLGQLYDVTTVDLGQASTVPEDVDALLIVGPKTAFSEAEQRAIDGFIMSGRSVAFLLGPMAPDLQTLTPNPTSHGLGGLLASYGVKIEDGVVLDAECATMNVAQQRGFLRISQPVRYPFIPVPKGLDPDHPLTRGLAQVSFPFSAALDISIPEGSGTKAEALVTSSDKSWLQPPPYNLDPMQKWEQAQLGEAKVHNIVVTLSGPMKSHFAPSPESGMSVDSEAAGPTTVDKARILVSGSHLFVLDQFMSKGNEALVLNLVDWLVLDEALLAVRSRGLQAAPLDEVEDSNRQLIKWGNVIGLPFAFVAFGLVRWRMREGRRTNASLS